MLEEGETSLVRAACSTQTAWNAHLGPVELLTSVTPVPAVTLNKTHDLM